MTGNRVADILKGKCDFTGSEIVCVYAKVLETYAVYRTPVRVMIQFADDAGLGADQRKALAPLNPLRGQINGLIDGWRSPKHSKNIHAKASMFDRRVADALVLGLQGEVCQAEALLAEIKEDVLEERTSPARVDYLVANAVTALFVILVACLATSTPYRDLYDYSPDGRELWLGAGAGALGALFSTAIAMRTRTILTDLQPKENLADAVARILIGATAGIVLVALLDAGQVSLSVAGNELSTQGAQSWTAFATAAFVAGFLERLVPDMLAKSAPSAGARSGGNPLAGGHPGSVTAGRSDVAGGNERNPLGQATGRESLHRRSTTLPTSETEGANGAAVSPAIEGASAGLSLAPSVEGQPPRDGGE